MADHLTKRQRSQLMSRIRAKDTGPEITVRKFLYKLGYRYRLHAKDLPGKPDIVFRSKKKAIFIHGCFWHQHPGCKDNHIPKSNIQYWMPKLAKTKKRDSDNQCKLIEAGWDILVIWECQLKDLFILKNRIIDFLAQ